MPFTVRELITKAYYKSGIVSRKFQSVSGEQMTDGLSALDELLSVEGITGTLIPYYKEYDLAAIVAQEKYFIPNLMSIENVTFTIDTVRYSMEKQGRNRYFGTGRANNIKSLPFSWHMERSKGGSDIYLYFLPNEAYPVKIWGKFMLEEVTDLCFDLSTVYDKFYLHYLQYALALDICEENNITLPAQAAKSLESLEEKLTYVSPIDLRTKKKSTLQASSNINWADVNFGRGWRP